MDIHSVEQQLQQAGLILRGSPIVDDQVHRVRHESDKSSKLSGWYVLHPISMRNGQPAIIGAAGTWKAVGEYVLISTIDQSSLDESARQEFREKLQQQREQADREIKAKQEAGKQKAEERWARAHEGGKSPYLNRKKIRPCGAIRFQGENLVIPIRDVTGTLINLQFIMPDGSKRFVTGARKKGGFHLIGTVKKTLLIAEGYATAASIHMATKEPVAVAFDAGNLFSVAQALRGLYPKADIIIAGDDDTETMINGELVNVGRIKATEAATAVGGVAVFPDFSMVTGKVAA